MGQVNGITAEEAKQADLCIIASISISTMRNVSQAFPQYVSRLDAL
ncbi:hypothetical protein ACEQPO_01130 [Bacillus sp. SL00103]